MNNLTTLLAKILKFMVQIWKTIAIFIGSSFMLIMIILVVAIVKLSSAENLSDNTKTITAGSNEEIAYVRLAGEIAYSTDDSWLNFNPFVIDPHRLRPFFKDLSNNSAIKAVVLEINSPGGSVAASEEIYQEVVKLDLVKPVYAYFGETAASGGYYIALPARKIFASIPTITGSIGVIAFDPDLSGLFDKLGVKMETYQTGQFKDLGSTSRAATDAERAIFTDLIDDSYQLFIDRIEENRTLDRNTILTLADGRVYSGKQAAANGLIDQVGTLDNLFSTVEQDLGLNSPTIKEYTPSGGAFGSLLGAKLGHILPSALLGSSLQSRQGLHYLWVR